MTERFEIFPQNVAKDGTLIIIQKELKLYNISDVVDLLNELAEENQQLKEYIDGIDKKSDELHDEKIRLIRENTRLKKKLKEHNDMLNWHQGGW